jgi:DNA-binding response OmpR family regulator
MLTSRRHGSGDDDDGGQEIPMIHRGTLLFADDDMDIQLMMRRVAEKQGYQILQAFDGEEALKLARERLPDLIILDVMMPKMDGRDVCKALRADERTREIPILIFSAKGEQWDRVSGLQVGADDYIDKPFNLDQLLSKVRYQLWKHGRVRPASGRGASSDEGGVDGGDGGGDASSGDGGAGGSGPSSEH